MELTHRRILKIAGPIILSNSTVPLLGAVDTAVIGQMGQAAPIGAVGLGATVLMIFYWAFGFLRMSTSGLAAQGKGAGDGLALSATLIRATAIGIGAGLVLILLHPLLFAGVFALAPASQGVEDLARQFLQIRIWAAPASIGLYALTGYLIGVERPRAVLVLQLWQNGVNLGLDLLFVPVLGWGVPGVAWASTIAELTGLALALWLVRDRLIRLPMATLMDRVALRQSFTASRDIMIRTVLLQLSFTAFSFLGARMGDTALAANQILQSFLGIMAFALDGFANAAETLVGQAIGARDRAGLIRATRLSMAWGYAGAAALALILAASGWLAIQTMTTAEDVRAEAVRLLPFLIAAPLIGNAAWIYDGVFIGALETGAMRRAAIGVAIFYALALALLVPPFGNPGLWSALMLMNAARGLALHRAFPQVLARTP